MPVDASAQICKHIWLKEYGFLCSVCLHTKYTRCLFCLCLIIIRGAQLSSAPPLTLFSQHYWSVLSRLHLQNSHVHIQIHYLVIRTQSLDMIPEMKVRKNRVTPRWAGNGIDFNLADCCHQGMKRDSAPCYTVAFVCLSQLCKVAEFCLGWKETVLSRYCSAFHQLLIYLMLSFFHHVNWN